MDMGQKLGRGLRPLFMEGKLGLHLTVTWVEAYFHTKWHLDPCSRYGLAAIDMGRKLGAPAPFWGGG